MGLLVYQFAQYNTVHEREQFRILCTSLRDFYSKSDEWCIFLSNYNIYDSELDGLIIKQDAIICVEFKKYGGEITAVENGQWTTADGTIIKGGSGKSVYQQAKINHICTRKGLKAATSLSNKQLSDIAALVVFHRPVTTLYNNLSEAAQCWLHITDNNHFIEKVQDITTDKLYLEPTQMQKLIDELALDESYLLDEYSNRELLEMDFTEEDLPLEESDAPTQPINEVKKFGQNEMTSDEVTMPTPYSLSTAISPLATFTASNREDVEIWAKSIFHNLNIDKFIEVYDTLIDRVPSWVKNEQGHRFIIVSFMFHDEVEAFEKYTNLKVRYHKSYNYWFCDASSDANPEMDVKKTPDVQAPLPIESQESPTTGTAEYILPHWLENFIFNNLGAKYAPDHESFASNLDSDEEKVKVYLGTYFPRSCAESYIIAKELFQNQIIQEKFSNRSVLNILDIACGTGGELVGTLLAIFEKLPQVTHITICAIDGNAHALKCFKKILTSVRNEFSQKTIMLSNAAIPLRSKADMQLLSEIVPDDFDFIFSNKSGSELLSITDASSNVYETILESFASKLSANGLMLVLDVTSKNRDGNFCPTVMNDAFNHFVKQHPDFKTIVPISCGLFEKKCSLHCYTQRLVTVSHREKTRDVSKISYRIISRSELADEILEGKEGKQYIVTPDREEKSQCAFSEAGAMANAFEINQ